MNVVWHFLTFALGSVFCAVVMALLSAGGRP